MNWINNIVVVWSWVLVNHRSQSTPKCMHDKATIVRRGPIPMSCTSLANFRALMNLAANVLLVPVMNSKLVKSSPLWISQGFVQSLPVDNACSVQTNFDCLTLAPGSSGLTINFELILITRTGANVHLSLGSSFPLSLWLKFNLILIGLASFCCSPLRVTARAGSSKAGQNN